MVGKLVAMLLGGYVCLRICIEFIPEITGLDIEALGSGIVYDVMGIALWLLPVAAIAGVLIWAANMISRWRGSRKDEDA